MILASGSFESDPELRDTYLPLPLVSVGHQGNTGDTLRLARAAGASLWHMSAFFGWLSFVHPDFPAGSRSTSTPRASSTSTATGAGSPTRPAGRSTTESAR